MISQRKRRAQKERLKSTSSTRSNSVYDDYHDDHDDGDEDVDVGGMVDFEELHNQHRRVCRQSSTSSQQGKRKRSHDNSSRWRHWCLTAGVFAAGVALALVAVHLRDLYRLGQAPLIKNAFSSGKALNICFGGTDQEKGQVIPSSQ